MQVKDPINTPSLSGWMVAAGLGALAAAVSWLQLGIGANGSVLIGGVVTLVVGVIIGLPSAPVPAAEPVVAPASGQPMSDATAPPAPTVAHPPAAAPQTPPVAFAASATPVAAAVAAPIIDPVPMPAPMPAPVSAETDKPRTLTAARDGRPDDLKLVRGIGPKMEAMLHGMGFFHFDQIADWTPAELAWVDGNLEGFKGRASRDEWVAQSKILAGGGTTEFSTRNR